MSKVWWRGVLVDDRTAKMLDELARLAGGIYINPTQGSYNTSVGASAGTHAGCGAVDLMHSSWSVADYSRVADLGRRIGFASWHRTPAQSNWPHHVHAIAVQPGGKWDRGCLSSGAHSQVVDYYNGRNGLASGGADDGTRRYVGVTWESYQQQTGDWFDMASEADLKNAVRDVLRDELLGHNDPMTKTARTIDVMYERQKVVAGNVEKILSIVTITNARVRKMYRTLIEIPYGLMPERSDHPAANPKDPGY